MARRLERQLAIERRQRATVVAASQSQQAIQPMKTDGSEAILLPRVLCRGTGLHFAFGALERLPRHMNSDRQHVRQPETRHQAQRSVNGAEALFAPAHECLSQVMAPVVRLE